MELDTRKVMDLTTRTKARKIYKKAVLVGEKAKIHDFHINHFASSTVMEQLAAVDLFTWSFNSNVKLLYW